MSARHRISSSIHACQRGFTLVELSIALVVIGIVVAGGLTLTTSMVDRQAYVQTGMQMDDLEKAISAYVATTKKLPCPATASDSIDSPAFGKSQMSCGSSGVAIGMLPVRTLGLRDRMAADEYGNRYTYAVAAPLTVSSNQYEASVGNIIIKDGTNPQPLITDAAYVIVSHGSDGKGAYRYETASLAGACSIAGKDTENCNGDSTFVNTRFNRGSVNAHWFDDTVRFRPKRLINMSQTATNEFWKANNTHIHNTNAGNVGIGVGAPTAKLQIDGGNGEALRLLGGDTESLAFIGAKNTNYTLQLDTQNTTSADLYILTKSAHAVQSIDIDHVSSGGNGIRVKTATFSTGLEITTGDNSMGIDVDSGTSRAIEVKSSNQRSIFSTNKAASNGSAVYGLSEGKNSSGLYGNSSGEGSYGVYGLTTGKNGSGVYGRAVNGTTNAVGVMGVNEANNGFAVYGLASGNNGYGVYGQNQTGYGVYGQSQSGYALYGQSTTGFGIWCQSNNCGGQRGWNETSDARLKDHVVTLNDAHGLDAIRKLRPVTYTWRDIGKETLGTQLGFIAQEVEAVLPEVVMTGGDQEIDLGDGKTETVTKTKSMMYASITVPLVRAVQQLADQFEALATSVKDMLARLSGIDTKIAALETDNAALKADNAALKESNAALVKRLDAIEAKLAH